MRVKFDTLFELLKSPMRQEGGVRVDQSVLMIYPAERELDFREELVDRFLPRLDAEKVPYRLLDLTGLLFEVASTEELEAAQEYEQSDYSWMKRALGDKLERTLVERITATAEQVPGGAVFLVATIALYPLVRFGDVLRRLGYLPARLVVAFPGEQRGGKAHYLGQPDGANYLAVQI